eukprot:Em0013g763a
MNKGVTQSPTTFFPAVFVAAAYEVRADPRNLASINNIYFLRNAKVRVRFIKATIAGNALNDYWSSIDTPRPVARVDQQFTCALITRKDVIKKSIWTVCAVVYICTCNSFLNFK